MFFSGGTFGHESEVRDSNRRQTGRRHQPRDMTEAQVAAVGNPSAAAREESGRHANDQKQMSAGPSFMDRMYAHDGSSGDNAHAARRHKSGPKDNLNVFSWKESDPAQGAPRQPVKGPRAARNVDATVPVPTVEDRRAAESKKFETHQESTFLKFSDTPASGEPAKAKAPVRGGNNRRTSATAMQENGMMGELMRDQQQRPHGKRVHAEQPAKRKGGAPVAAGDPGVAGFPGMGKTSAPSGVPHLHRKPAGPNVLPPWAQHDEELAPPSAGADAAPAGPPAPGRQPAYCIDERDYDDHAPPPVAGEDARLYADHQRRMQEIEMYDDDDDRHYAPTSQQQQQRLQPRWLDEQASNDDRHGEASEAQQRRYDFDPHQQEFYEDGDDGDRHDYR